MRVLKFGGSSVANATNISKVLDIVEGEARKESVILVCSAIRGCTDTLIAIGKGEADSKDLRIKHSDIINRLFTGDQKEEAVKEINAIFDEVDTKPTPIEAYGEILSTKIIARKLACEGYDTKWLDSRDLIVRGNEPKSFEKIAAAVSDGHQIYVAPGFIARDENGAMCTLGRGGSDYSAALYAAGCKASNLEIWTDVPGIMTTNPKVVPAARTVSNISYKAALDLAENGAKVLYAPTVKPAMNAGISFSILNTFDPTNPGTLVSNLPPLSIGVWRGVTSTSDGKTARMCLVGEGPVGEELSRKRVMSALKENGIRLLGIESRDEGRLIFADVLAAEEKAATVAIHSEFFEDKEVSVTKLFIAGYGAVGKSLVKLIGESSERVAKRTGKSIRIIGVSNSSHYAIDLKGIAPSEVSSRLENGQSTAESAYFKEIMEKAPRGAVFADCTNSHSISEQYEALFDRGISVVTSNRRALAGPFSQYISMKTAARENGVSFRYDTTVGTALPILESLSSGANSCDKVTSIEAVVSCTLNHIITGYDGENTESFGSLLRHAQAAGLTEHDPRTDLGGKDALRKLLILAREAGIPLEAEDVKITPMVGPEFFEGSVEDFYKLLDEQEPRFIQREKELDEMGMRQRFVASVVKDPSSPIGYKASIEIKLVGVDSPFYWISGTENVTIIKSEYISHPLVLKGSGEGALLAASGVINDILKK